MSDDGDSDSIGAEDFARLNYIRFLGQVENIPAVLQNRDVVCLPTRYGEGLRG